jgi:hypothetical protein
MLESIVACVSNCVPWYTTLILVSCYWRNPFQKPVLYVIHYKVRYTLRFVPAHAVRDNNHWSIIFLYSLYSWTGLLDTNYEINWLPSILIVIKTENQLQLPMEEFGKIMTIFFIYLNIFYSQHFLQELGSSREIMLWS